ncbi:MAG: sulfatase-like hydrolase/transferase, partial [Silvanigrellaceae bacterium]|nr:sulfatase-like hydrolase/transferase [Silvanigrellaceae bacterium]
LIENPILGAFTALQSVLIMPHFHRFLPSLLSNPEISDPRLITHTVSTVFAEQKLGKQKSPVFLTTFFSTAHFPYAAPSPWFAKFQHRNSSQRFLFRKDPDIEVTTNPNTNTVEISKETKEQTIALYDGALSAIDEEFKKIFQKLEAKGWLENAIILVLGDHGENLYDGKLGMGHGDGVQGEFSTLTPLIFLLTGKAKNNKSQNTDEIKFVRSIDVAPTVLKRLQLNDQSLAFDGVPLFDHTKVAALFPRDAGYTESGIWFSSSFVTPEKQSRIVYPSVTGILELDPGMNYEFYLNPVFAQTIFSVKERTWISDRYRLITRATTDGIQISLYDRKLDLFSNQDLLLVSSPKMLFNYKKIASSMLKEMNKYLQSRGVEIVKNFEDKFFYSENVPQ